MATKTRVRKSPTPIPTDRTEASRFIANVGNAQRKLDAIDLELETEILKLKAARATEIENLRKERNMLVTGLYAYATAHRKELLADGGKTAVFATGTLSWRYSPPAVSVEDDTAMIALLKKLGHEDYVRTKEELDRESLLRDREDLNVKGLDFTQREDFIITPAEHCSEVKKTRTIVLE